MSYIAKNGRLYTSGASEALTLLDDKFSVNKSYSKGDSCIYNDYLWKFTSDKPAGEWDSSVVEQCRIMDFVDDINGRLTLDTYTINWKGKGFFFYKQGHIVVMTSPEDLPIGQTLSAGSTILFTVPKEFKPAQSTYGLCSNDTKIMVGVKKDGILWVYSPTNLTGLHNMALTCVYFVD